MFLNGINIQQTADHYYFDFQIRFEILNLA